MNDALTIEDAEHQLDGVALVSYLSGPLTDLKAVRDRCLAAGIPVLLGCPSPGKSCGSSTHLLVGEDDVPRVVEVMRNDWRDSLMREGLAPAVAMHPVNEDDPDAEPPCPACGHAGPLADGACADCGLVVA